MRGVRFCGVVSVTVTVAMLCAARCGAEDSKPEAAAAVILPEGQEARAFAVRVVDEQGNPVAKAKVTPWALRSSLGHGGWMKDDKWVGGLDPKEVVTDENGAADIGYPLLRNVEDKVKVIGVSLFVDHPDFAYVDSLHTDVPLKNGPYEIKLKRGAAVEVRPVLDGKPAALDNIYALWSDGRSWRNKSALERSPEGTLKIPVMPPGENSVLLVRLDGDRATHFSRISDFKVEADNPALLDVELRPAMRIEGTLSEDVPRPVKHGRVKLETLPPTQGNYKRVSWTTWVPVKEDGTFTIESWPEGERMQLTALCDGYMAMSGAAPDVVKNPPDPNNDGFSRPQVFDVEDGDRISVAMMPLVKCEVTVLDLEDKGVAGVTIMSWPNVGWWNGGSQIYCHPMVRGEALLKEGDYEKASDKSIENPFQAMTDAKGVATLELPEGHEGLAAANELYQLPMMNGRRDARVDLVAGQTTETTLRLQPKENEILADWDKIAKKAFGCTQPDGRRIGALPGVGKKLEDFAKRFQKAGGKEDKKLSADVYEAVIKGYEKVGDMDAAKQWTAKLEETAREQ